MPPKTLSASHPSPKRKRDQQPPPPPLLNTTLRTTSTPPPPHNSVLPDDSQNAVADQLRGMSLTDPSVITISPLTPTNDVVNKRPRLDEMAVDRTMSLDEHLVGAERKATRFSSIYETITIYNRDEMREIPETPQSQTRQPLLFSEPGASAAQPVAFVSSTITTSTSPHSAAANTSLQSRSRTQRPHQRNRSPSPPLSNLTWQDGEITGHLTRPFTDPDDDGTGWNGIGFRPTPTIAHARAQRRRQQVLDWKAREAREARAKRSERRRRGTGGASSREATVEREMRAADPVSTGRTVKFDV
jgi:hypothetical protein